MIYKNTYLLFVMSLPNKILNVLKKSISSIYIKCKLFFLNTNQLFLYYCIKLQIFLIIKLFIFLFLWVLLSYINPSIFPSPHMSTNWNDRSLISTWRFMYGQSKLDNYSVHLSRHVSFTVSSPTNIKKTLKKKGLTLRQGASARILWLTLVHTA